MVQPDYLTLEEQIQNRSLEKYEPPSIDGLQTTMQPPAWTHNQALHWMKHHPQLIIFQGHVKVTVDDQDNFPPQQSTVYFVCWIQEYNKMREGGRERRNYYESYS